jgi:Acetyl-CoA dehydrogenase C-terminal like
VATEIQEFIDTEAGNGQLKEERAALGRALGEMQQVLGAMMTWLTAVQGGEMTELYKVGLHSRRVLLALGDLVLAWLLMRQAEVALRALGGEVSDVDRAFYTGKVAAARFFAREVLPRIGADRRVIENATLDVMELPEEAF